MLTKNELKYNTMKKLTLILLTALLSVGAWAATVNDLVAIDHDWVFVADDITSNGTVGLTANTLYADGKIFTPTTHSVATDKGSNTFAGGSHLNSLRLKLVQDRLAFKVSGPCSVTFYTQNHSGRGIVVSKADRTSTDDAYLAQQPVNTPVWTVDLDEAGVYYLSNYGGDFYFAGFEVIMDPIAGSQVFGIKRDVAEETSTSSDSQVTDRYAVSDDVLVDPSVAGVTMAKNFGTQSVMTDKARAITWQNGATTVNCYVDKGVKNYRTYLNGASVTAINDNCYFGFDMVVEAGYKASLNRLVSDVMKTNSASHYQVKIYNNGELVKTLADIEATNTNTNMKRNVDLSQDAALQNMSGTITVKIFVWNTSSTQYIIVKDLYVNAVVEEIDPVDPALIKTFGAERANDATVYAKIDPAVTGITVGDLTTNYKTLSGTATLYHGSESGFEFASSFQNNANSQAIKTQAGETDGAETNNAAIYFDLTAAAGYKMRITNIASDWYVGNKGVPYYYEYIIEDSQGNVLYKSPEPLSVTKTTLSEYFDYSVNLKAVETLKNLTGAIRVKFVWWVSSTSTNIALKNLKVQAVIEEPEPEPESTWRDIKMDFTTESSFIRDVTTTEWSSFTTGIAVAENGTVSAVESTAANSVGTLNAKYVNAQWGLSAPTFAVAVEGPVKISLGSSYYDGTITVKKGEEVLTTFASNIPNKLWSQSNPDCVSYLYMGEAATLTIISSSYCPYIAVEKFALVNEDFKIDFRTNPYTVILPTTGVLPAGVTVDANNYKDNQHGTINGKMHVNVAGPTKFTIGGCQFNNNNAVIKDAMGNTLATLDTKAAGCDNGFGTYSHFATYFYTGEAQELVIDLGSYCPYIFVEKVATIDDQMTEEAMDELDGFTGDVTVNRSLTAGMFNTICLPFNMSASEISAKLGTCDIRELSSAALNDNDNELVLNFATVSAIEAGKPYLISPTAAVTGWTMEGVTLSTTTTPTVTSSVDFIGVLTPTQLTASENTLCVGAGNTLFYVGMDGSLNGLRAYFTVKGAAAGAPARISLGSHVATDLENANVNANVNKLIEQGRVIIRIDGHDYDLNGHLLK